MNDGYLPFKLVVAFAAVAICFVILAGVIWLPEDVMKVAGALLDEVPLVGTMYSSLAGIDKQLLQGNSIPISEHFRIMWLCIANNTLDAVFLGAIYAMFTKKEGSGVRAFLTAMPRMVLCTVVSVFVLMLIRQIPDYKTEVLVRALFTAAVFLAGITIMLGKGKGSKAPAITFALRTAISAFKAIAGTDLLCVLFFVGASLKRLSYGMLGWWLQSVAFSVAVFLLASLLGFVLYGRGFTEGFLD